MRLVKTASVSIALVSCGSKRGERKRTGIEGEAGRDVCLGGTICGSLCRELGIELKNAFLQGIVRYCICSVALIIPSSFLAVGPLARPLPEPDQTGQHY